MPRIFGRVARVTVARRPAISSSVNPQYFERNPNAIVIDSASGARISGSIKKTLNKMPNPAAIKIYNLSESTRTEMEKNVLAVTVHAGFDNVYQLVTTGDCKRCWSYREGTDIITEIRVGDGILAYAGARMTRSYKPPIQAVRVLSDAAKSMGLKLPPEAEQSSELKAALAAGISVHGPTRDILTRQLAPYGLTWSVQNGQLQILADEQTRPGSAILINAEAGIIGTPERSYPDKPGGKSEVKFEVSLYPAIVPGSLIKLESEFLNIVLKATDVDHDFDTKEGDFKTSVNGKPISESK